ncbi:tyrosine-type recombinase/integrase [Dokdonella soli]|uniref:Tyrosine-type recombinase/integrase n=1 Tax=Dokdonella soli TaxID=529810 RepID=A0ABN1IJM8_9GAMM
MLTDVKLRTLTRRESLYRVADGGGLAIEVPPAGALRWRFRYRFNGKAKMLSFGTYPDVKASEARNLRDDARRFLRQGIDPSAQRQEKKRTPAIVPDAQTFGAIAREWIARQEVADVTANKNRWIMETFLLPDLGNRPIREITSRELLITLRKIERTGKLETAKRARVKAGQVFRHAILEGLCENDPTPSLRGALKSPRPKHHASITDPARVGELLRAIDGFSGQQVTLYALKLAPLVFVRPGELRHAEWSEIDLDRAMWRIPAARMKMNSAHLVPLSKQAVALLRELFEITGEGRHVFPGMLSSSRPMSENTVNAALRRLGYSNEEMTGHGFRSMAATLLNEQGWNADAIERQLSHAESNKVREAYTHAAQYLDERVRMMQAWANYLDGLRSGAVVVPFRRAG